MKRSPATVASALRVAPVFDSNSNHTAAEPLPVGFSTRSQCAFVDACQLHPSIVDRFTDMLPAVCDTRPVDWFSSKRHGAGSCEMVARDSFNRTVALRVTAAPFGAMVSVREPSPCPADGDT